MMTQRWFGKLTCLALLFAFPASMMGADLNSAMLVGTGGFALNGAVAPARGVVFQGDKISTQADGAVALTTQGSSVVVAADSTVVFRGRDLEVDGGTVQVTTDRNMAVQVQKLTVRPANSSAKYRVTHADGAVLVAALNGSVTVNNGASTSVISEGNTATLPDASPADPQQPTPPVAQAGSRVSNVAAGLAAVAVAVASAALVVATTGAPPSPTKP